MLYASPRHLRGLLCFGDVLGLQALPALGYLVGDLLTLFEGPEPGALYAGVVHEDVLAAVVGGDEAVALLLAEPANRPWAICWSPPFIPTGSAPTKKPPLSPGGASIKTKPTFYYSLIIP